MGVQTVGASVRRTEDPRLLRGEGAYVDDLRIPGVLHMAVLRSPEAHARIRSVDVGPARALAGVVDAFSAAELGRDQPAIPALFAVESFRPAPQYPLAVDTVRYVGDPVAVVVAESRHVAEDALELIEVDYEPLEAVVDASAAIQPGAPVLHDDAPDNVAATMVYESGDVEAAFAGADRVVRERLDVQRYTGIPLETRGVVAHRDPVTGELTVWASTQWPHTMRTILAGMLGVPARAVRVVTPDIGGGFGVKADFSPEDFLVPYVAGRIGRPVKWIEDRNEHFLAIAHSREQIHEVELALRDDGAILGLRARHITDCGAYQRPLGLVNASLAGTSLGGVYRVPAYRVEAVCASTNKAPASPYRGAGVPEATFARERLFDIAARELGIDRVELRRRNLLTPDELPHDTGLVSLEAAVVLDSGDFPAALDRALEMAGYADFSARQQAARDEGRLIGLGICVYHQVTGTGPFEGGSVRVDPTGEVTITSGAAPQGQGTATMLAQIAADELQVPHESIKVVFGDTGRLPFGMGTYASRNAVMAGTSVVMAARQVRDKARELAAHLLEADPADLELEDGAFTVRGVPTSRVGWAGVAAAATPGGNRPAGMEPDLEAVQYFENMAAPYSYGIHVAEVEVDPHTGYTTVTRYVVVNDAGRIVNPRNAEGQIVGGVAQGLGGALMEELVYAPDGQPQTTSFLDYLVPGSLDVPDVEIAHLASTTPLNPLGVKGMGEGGAIGAHTAVANAVADAIEHLGCRVTRTPLTPAAVWELLRSATAGAPA
ncbi:xanthine dehydrogenase family protein molybdopterin-binding subunit [Geodermatophilus sp. TF02-6]|uniref:xanthine dehydrogenase family protein molybdopterin-binding subunit n=1 Tax=Geodermatophilus sp. TF02-6 TaxID=2250575 RepID=UPI000DEB53E0|nr:xanthine dehydrogenase family protein molybdopterin-binding subunit [Geodermatophilus sp. TF02-6]RBY79567.1 xanthine dehydrogenase family protein molybdopterin-binding subunit [Geodermatophilus sp. TF02-6]